MKQSFVTNCSVNISSMFDDVLSCDWNEQEPSYAKSRSTAEDFIIFTATNEYN